MINCSYFNENDSSSRKFEITNECAQFDFFAYSLVGGTFCLLGLIGNIISFIVLLKDATTSGGGSAATSFILGALAVADSLVLIAALPLFVLSHAHHYFEALESYFEVYISIMPFLYGAYLMPYTGTIFLTVLVSLNRFEAVCRPFTTKKLWGGEKVKWHVICIAVFSILYNIPRFFEYQQKEVCKRVNQSMHVFERSAFGDNTIYRILYTNILYFVVMHGGPLLSLAFLNVNLIKALKQQAKRRAEMKMAGHQQDVTLVLVVVVFVFICCQTPTFVDQILWTIVDESNRATCGQWHYYYTALADLMVIANSSVNFVIYVLTSPRFRQILSNMCGGVVPGIFCFWRRGKWAPGRSGGVPQGAFRMERLTEADKRNKTETILLCPTKTKAEGNSHNENGGGKCDVTIHNGDIESIC